VVFTIGGPSTAPTIIAGDSLTVLPVFTVRPRADIVVHRPPVPNPGVTSAVHRVIGLPGESIDAHGGFVYVNGSRLDESYLPRGTSTSDFQSGTIPDGRYFVMGDNRGNSKDSRYFGPVAANLIIGVVAGPARLAPGGSGL
jgi:signal peptidase I